MIAITHRYSILSAIQEVDYCGEILLATPHQVDFFFLLLLLLLLLPLLLLSPHSFVHQLNP